MTENLPILYQNIMFGLPSDFAREVAQLSDTISGLIDMAKSVWEDQRPDLTARQEMKDNLLKFILTRHANWRFGGNLKPSYLVAA